MPRCFLLFYITRAAVAPAIIASVDANKAGVQALYARWEELEAVKARR